MPVNNQLNFNGFFVGLPQTGEIKLSGHVDLVQHDVHVVSINIFGRFQSHGTVIISPVGITT